MSRTEILDLIEETEDVELVGCGQFESAGQVYYELSVAVHEDLEDFAETLKEKFDKYESYWRVQTYPNWNGPTGWDPEKDKEIQTNMRIKKNLYNEHKI